MVYKLQIFHKYIKLKVCYFRNFPSLKEAYLDQASNSTFTQNINIIGQNKK